MATKTILNVRTDIAVKRAAQKAAKDLGISLSVVVNASLREFVRNPRVELEPLVPNARTRRVLTSARKKVAKEKIFDSIESLISELDS